jgi:hypothetical protein
MYTRYRMALAVAAGLFGAGLGPAAGQTTIETQRGAPPAPNAAAPEYAPSPVAPAKPPVLKPQPGEPALAPGPGTIGDRGQPPDVVGYRAILGFRPMTAVLVGLGVVGLIVLVVGGMTRKLDRRPRIGLESRSNRRGDRNHG